MRVLDFLTATILFARADGADAEDVIQVVCDSGTVDDSSKLDSLTESVCRSECTSKCAGEMNEESLDDCLGQGSLAGCLFNVQLVKSADLTHCTTAVTSGNTTHPVVLTLLSKSALSVYSDGSAVAAVNLELDLQDISAVENCNKVVTSGVSLTAFDSASCTVSGTPSVSGQFSVHNKSIRINVTELFNGVYGSAKDLPIFVQFEDDSCAFGVSEADMLFSVTYKDGYRPTQSCLSTDGCEACLANGCNYCDWSALTNTLFPEWMPSWLTQLKGDKQGLCGINSALCKTTGGSISTCGVAKAFRLGTLMTILLGALYLY